MSKIFLASSFFSPSQDEEFIIPFLLACKVSIEKSAVNLISVLLKVTLEDVKSLEKNNTLSLFSFCLEDKFFHPGPLSGSWTGRGAEDNYVRVLD